MNIKKTWRKMWQRPIETSKQKKLRVVTSILWATLIIWATIPGSTVVYKAEAEVITPMTDKEMISLYSKEFGVNEDLIYSVMMCESNGEYVVGDDGNAKGHFQFWDETWERYSKKYRAKYGVEDTFDKRSLHDQIKLASFAFSLGEDSRREWTTYRSIKNGGTYKFYSRALKKEFTVRCSLQDMR